MPTVTTVYPPVTLTWPDPGTDWTVVPDATWNDQPVASMNLGDWFMTWPQLLEAYDGGNLTASGKYDPLKHWKMPKGNGKLSGTWIKMPDADKMFSAIDKWYRTTTYPEKRDVWNRAKNIQTRTQGLREALENGDRYRAEALAEVLPTEIGGLRDEVLAIPTGYGIPEDGFIQGSRTLSDALKVIQDADLTLLQPRSSWTSGTKNDNPFSPEVQMQKAAGNGWEYQPSVSGYPPVLIYSPASKDDGSSQIISHLDGVWQAEAMNGDGEVEIHQAPTLQEAQQFIESDGFYSQDRYNRNLDAINRIMENARVDRYDSRTRLLGAYLAAYPSTPEIRNAFSVFAADMAQGRIIGAESQLAVVVNVARFADNGIPPDKSRAFEVAASRVKDHLRSLRSEPKAGSTAPIEPGFGLKAVMDQQNADQMASSEAIEAFATEFQGFLEDAVAQSAAPDLTVHRAWANQGTIQFEFRDKNGNYAGHINRTWRSGDLHVHNEYFKLVREYQGKGIAERLSPGSPLFDYYKANGVVDISVQANIDVGGYTWAKLGFENDNPAGTKGYGVSALNVFVRGNGNARDMMVARSFQAGLEGEVWGLFELGLDPETLAKDLGATEQELIDWLKSHGVEHADKGEFVRDVLPLAGLDRDKILPLLGQFVLSKGYTSDIVDHIQEFVDRLETKPSMYDVSQFGKPWAVEGIVGRNQEGEEVPGMIWAGKKTLLGRSWRGHYTL